ncbi:MAG: zinc ribbon domain-containing protein [Eggerthellaceae bacterium]|nr:zinc ribbon domain-containing protein [Eggerthellaceae bacterium]
MKKCNICGYAETDDAQFCSNCGHNEFTKATQAAQSPYGQQGRPGTAQYGRTVQPAEPELKKPIGWAIVTFLFPYIGGYFTIKPDVSKGIRMFAIVWSIIAAVAYAINAWMYYNYDTTTAIICIVLGILCLVPIFVYLPKAKQAQIDAQNAASEKLTEDLLNQPLKTFADEEVEKIAERYKNA